MKLSSTTKVINLKIEDAFKLHNLKANQHEQECATGKYEGESFASFAETIGIIDYFVAERVANTIWFDYDFIEAMHKRGAKEVILYYDMSSDHLISIYDVMNTREEA